MTLPILLGTPLSFSEAPVQTSDDVLETYSIEIREQESAPVRDAIVAGQTALHGEYQRNSTEAAYRSSVLYATGNDLDVLGADRRVYRQVGELDPAYRTRILAIPDVVTPEAVINAVNAILDNYTDKVAQYFEQLDGFFVSDGSPDWFCGVLDGETLSEPLYHASRFYDELTDRSPGACRVFDDVKGRVFVIRIPDLAPVDDSTASVFTTTGEIGMYVGDGSFVENGSFINVFSDTEFQIYQSIANTVDQIKGHGIRWVGLVDPII